MFRGLRVSSPYNTRRLKFTGSVLVSSYVVGFSGDTGHGG